MPMGQMPVGEHRLLTKTLDRYTRAGLPEICSQQNFMDTARDDKGQNTDKEQSPSPRIEIKITDPAGNQTRAAAPGWKPGTLPITPRRRTI